MYKEITSAILMTVIVLIFGFALQDLTGESRIMPELLLYFLVFFTLGQYCFAFVAHRKHLDVKLTTKGYPLKRVSILIGLTILYLAVTETVGFYLASYVYFVAVSLIGQPMAITKKVVITRLIVCALCIIFLYILFTVLLAVQIPLGFMKF